MTISETITETRLRLALGDAYETNRRLNRRTQKMERRINRWESRTYTIKRVWNWRRSWVAGATARAVKAESELERLKNADPW